MYKEEYNLLLFLVLKAEHKQCTPINFPTTGSDSKLFNKNASCINQSNILVHRILTLGLSVCDS